MRGEVLGPMRRMGEGGAARDREERERGRAGVSLCLWRGGRGGVSRIFRVRNKKREFNYQA